MDDIHSIGLILMFCLSVNNTVPGGCSGLELGPQPEKVRG